MQKNNRCRRVSFVLLLLLFTSMRAYGAASVNIVNTGNASYSIQGSGMDGVAGIELTISYDAASLASPTATQGNLVAGAIFAANTTRAGSIKIAIVSAKPFSGSGQIASISFASRTGSGGIASITTSMIDSKGAPMSAQAAVGTTTAENTAAAATISTPGIPFSQPMAESTTSVPTQSTSVAAVATSKTTYLGTVTMPTEQQQPEKSPLAEVSPPPQAPAPQPLQPVIAPEEQPRTAAKQPPVEEKSDESVQYIVYKGVLDRFRSYAGEKSLPLMKALFNTDASKNIRQEPEVVLSDGKRQLTIIIDFPARISSSPNFALNGARQISLKRDKEFKNRWILVAVPDQDTWKATLTILAGAEGFEYPLAVAPPVSTVLTLDEAGWNRFLKETGTAKAPLFDLNRDGIRDYIDEFIFVANHLALKESPILPVSSGKTK